MRKSRFTETQIIGILKAVEAGWSKAFAANTAFPTPPTINGNQSMAAWNDCHKETQR
jgi:hypothetical protein